MDDGTDDDGGQQLYYLFGYPISHSASPAFHNHLFSNSKANKTYTLHSTTQITPHLRSLCRSRKFGGASVTMPIKVEIMSCGILDSISEESRILGAVNTIVPVHDGSGVKLVGTNTDWIGILNALLPHRPSTKAALIIGAGGACRAAIYALTSPALTCETIYLLNRDESETRAVLDQFKHLSKTKLVVDPPEEEVGIVIGCIPSLPASSLEEIRVDKVARAILSSPSSCRKVFLEMCYKPRITPFMACASSTVVVVSGIEAMLEQGFAQQRMWASGSAVWDDRTKNFDLGGSEVEESTRRLIRDMDDVQPDPLEKPLE